MFGHFILIFYIKLIMFSLVPNDLIQLYTWKKNIIVGHPMYDGMHSNPHMTFRNDLVMKLFMMMICYF